MDKETVKLIGAYVIGLAIITFTGYMVATGREIPEFWSNLAMLAAGFVFLGEAVRRTFVRRNSNRR